MQVLGDLGALALPAFGSGTPTLVGIGYRTDAATFASVYLLGLKRATGSERVTVDRDALIAGFLDYLRGRDRDALAPVEAVEAMRELFALIELSTL